MCVQVSVAFRMVLGKMGVSERRGATEGGAARWALPGGWPVEVCHQESRGQGGGHGRRLGGGGEGPVERSALDWPSSRLSPSCVYDHVCAHRAFENKMDSVPLILKLAFRWL